MTDGDLFAEVFVTLLVIMDPVGNIPVFLALTARQPERTARRAALQASAVALAVILVFAFFGQGLLSLLGIGVESIQVAGGLLLLLVALELLQGRALRGAEVAAPNVALVPLGTPLLAGPGAIAAVMLFIGRADAAGEAAVVVGALVAVVLVVYLALRFAASVEHLVHENVIHLLTRIMGLLLAAIAVQLVAAAVEEWIRHGVT